MVLRADSDPDNISNGPTWEQQVDLLRGYRDGFQAMHVVTTGLELDLFRRLAEHPRGITPEDLARQTGFHPPYVSIWCSTAYYYRLLEVDSEERYRLAPYMDALLADRSGPDSMASTLTSAITRHGPQMARFSEYIKSGEVGSHAESYAQNPDRHDPPRSQELAHRRIWTQETIVKAPDVDAVLQAGGRLLDVGCGPGVLLMQLAELYPSASFVGVDVVEVGGLETARRLIQDRGLETRINVERVPAQEIAYQEEFDCVVMTRMFHELMPKELREVFFRAAYRSLRRPGVFLNRDIAYPNCLEEARDPLYRAGMFNQYQEMAWGTEHPTWDERKALLFKVGFDSMENHFIFGEPQGPHYLDIARKT